MLAGGFVDSLPLRSALWVASIVVDVAGVLAAGSENDWRISPAHFAERYALIVIIALGESIVAVGVAAADLPRDFMFALSVTIAFGGVAALWWAYFGFVSGAVERALQRAPESRRGPLARVKPAMSSFACRSRSRRSSRTGCCAIIPTATAT